MSEYKLVWLIVQHRLTIARLGNTLLPLQGGGCPLIFSQGAASLALGYVLVAPSGRALNACAYSLIQFTKLEIVILRVQEQFFLGYKNSFS